MKVPEFMNQLIKPIRFLSFLGWIFVISHFYFWTYTFKLKKGARSTAQIAPIWSINEHIAYIVFFGRVGVWGWSIHLKFAHLMVPPSWRENRNDKVDWTCKSKLLVYKGFSDAQGVCLPHPWVNPNICSISNRLPDCLLTLINLYWWRVKHVSNPAKSLAEWDAQTPEHSSGIKQKWIETQNTTPSN